MNQTLIAGMPSIRQGLNYLVPTKWWNQFYSLNKSVSNLEAIHIPQLSLINFVDHFLINYQSQLIENIQQKCLYLNFHQVKINLEINQFIDWTPINPELWKIVKKKLKEKNEIMTFIDINKKIDFKKTKQMQLIYCSKTKSQLFVGFLPKEANLISVIRQIGFEMGFIEIERSKITFVQKSPQISHNFHELQKYTVETVPDIFLMMFNMQRKQHDQQNISNNLPFTSNNNTMNESNQAVIGDLNTMSNDSRNPLLDEPIQNRTMSTGAQTPFSFFSQGFDLDRQYRVNQLFRTKQPEEIQEMKEKAHKIIHHQSLISIPSKSAETRKTFLQRLAEEILEPIIKRKTEEIQKAYQ